MGDDCISKVRVHMLEDYDVTSCYDVINTADTFVLDRTWSKMNSSLVGQLGITYVNVTTHMMACEDPFHIAMYHLGTDTASQFCNKVFKPNIPCKMLHHQVIDRDYTQCQFECNCQHNECEDQDVIYLKAANPKEGGLCDITMLPY